MKQVECDKCKATGQLGDDGWSQLQVMRIKRGAPAPANLAAVGGAARAAQGMQAAGFDLCPQCTDEGIALLGAAELFPEPPPPPAPPEPGTQPPKTTAAKYGIAKG